MALNRVYKDQSEQWLTQTQIEQAKTMAATNIFVLATVCIAFGIGLIHASILRNPPVYLGPGSVPQPINIEVQTDKRVVYTYGDKTQGTCDF